MIALIIISIFLENNNCNDVACELKNILSKIHEEYWKISDLPGDDFKMVCLSMFSLQTSALKSTTEQRALKMSRTAATDKYSERNMGSLD